jgi:biotin transporter BioY
MNYRLSLISGVLAGSIILLLARFMNFPITGFIISFLVAGFVTTFLYTPQEKSNHIRKGTSGAAAGLIIAIIISIIFVIYYLPRISTLPLENPDIQLAVAVIIVVLITYLGGIVLGNVGGTFGSILRDNLDFFRKKESK